jgi:hypothetical protein
VVIERYKLIECRPQLLNFQSCHDFGALRTEFGKNRINGFVISIPNRFPSGLGQRIGPADWESDAKYRIFPSNARPLPVQHHEVTEVKLGSRLKLKRVRRNREGQQDVPIPRLDSTSQYKDAANKSTLACAPRVQAEQAALNWKGSVPQIMGEGTGSNQAQFPLIVPLQLDKPDKE